MKTFEMEARPIPLDDSWDVIAAGGGPAGCAAAIAAALAASMAASADGDVHAVDAGELRARLKGHGAHLPDAT